MTEPSVSKQMDDVSATIELYVSLAVLGCLLFGLVVKLLVWTFGTVPLDTKIHLITVCFLEGAYLHKLRKGQRPWYYVPGWFTPKNQEMGPHPEEHPKSKKND
jgi:hypothetical protein